MPRGPKYPPRGARFGRLTVGDPGPNDDSGRSQVHCTCDCGGPSVLVVSTYLRSGRRTTCNRCSKKKDRPAKVPKPRVSRAVHPPPGTQFGRLTVTRPGPSTKEGSSRVYCDCNCGNRDLLVRSGFLRMGTTRSCGCSNGKRKPPNVGSE